MQLTMANFFALTFENSSATMDPFVLPFSRWQDSPTEDELAISAAQLMGRPSLRDIAIEDVDRASLDDRQRKAVMGRCAIGLGRRSERGYSQALY